MANQALRILLADQNLTSAKRLSTYLQESGFEVHLLHDGVLAQEHILEFKPHFIIIDLTLPNFSAYQCLEFLRKEDMLENDKTRVFVLSQHNAKQNVEACLQRGAADYLVKPVNPIDVLTRLALALQAKNRVLKETVSKDMASEQLNYYLQLVELFAKTLSVRTSSHQVHFQLLRMLSLAINAVRISLIKLDNGKAPTVIASSDNDKFSQFELNLDKYPEIDYVQRTHKPLFIENLQDDVMMAFIKDQMKSVSFNTMIVLPIFNQEGLITGILSARWAESTQLRDEDVRLCNILAQMVSTFWIFKDQAKLSTPKAS